MSRGNVAGFAALRVVEALRAAAAGEVVTFAALLEACGIASRGALKVHVFHARKLGLGIVNARGVGYRLAYDPGNGVSDDPSSNGAFCQQAAE
jgi:dihydroxyacetone kinase